MTNVAELERLATTQASRGHLLDAVLTRERALAAAQAAFGEPSREADRQKMHLGELMLQLAQGGGGGGGGDAAGAKSTAGGGGGGGGDGAVLPTAGVVGRLCAAEQLLRPASTLPETQNDPHVVELRGQLLLAVVGHYHTHGRPRAAVPVLKQALTHLEAAATLASGQPFSIAVANAHLSLAVLLSAANHHPEALAAAHTALAVTLRIEEQRWAADPLGGGAASMANATTTSGAGGGGGGGGASRVDADGIAIDDGDDGADATQAAGAPRGKIYFGPFQAACYHNIGAEQEHLGLPELALESYQTGFELAAMSLGDAHSLTARLKTCYAQLFTSLNFKHFASPATLQKGAVQRAFRAPAEAVKALNASYVQSRRHQHALDDEARREEAILRRVQLDAAAAAADGSGVDRSRASAGASRRGGRSSSLANRSRPPSAAKTPGLR